MKWGSLSKSVCAKPRPPAPQDHCWGAFPPGHLSAVWFGFWRFFSYSSILEPSAGGVVAAQISLIQSRLYKFSFKCRSLSTFTSAFLESLKYGLQAHQWAVLRIKRCRLGTSPVVQWLRLLLPLQGSIAGGGNKDSTCHGAGPKGFSEKKRDVVLCLRNIKQEGESKRPGDKKSLSSVA